MITNFRFLLPAVLLLGMKASSFAQNYQVFYGSIHAHTSYSDGNKDSSQTGFKTPADAYRFAKATKHLDFLGISEHNHRQAGMRLANYAKGLADADAANEDGRFVCLYGMEYGVISNGGHVLIYGSRKLIGWEPGNYDTFSAKSDYTSLFRIVSADPEMFATLAHPKTTDYGNLAGKPWDLSADQSVTGVALSNGPHDSKKTDYSERPPVSYYNYYKKLLSLGYIVGPTMDQDNHNTTFGRISANRTAVLAQVLHRDSIIAAYKANRFYATEDWNAKVDFTINGMPLGSYVKNSAELKIKVAVTDPDPNDAVKSINLMFGKPGSGQLPQLLVSSTSGTLAKDITLQPGDAFYYYLEIVQQDGDKIYTSPIWAKY